jgi:hypothetical protein
MALNGSQKFAVLLCRLSDTQGSDVHEPDFYKEMFVNHGTEGLNDYWVDASLGNIDLDGSEIFGWKTLDQDRADYVKTHTSRGDKIQGAIDAFSIDTTKYAGVVAIFSEDLGDAAASGKGVLAGPGDVNITFMAHETAHVMGVEHSFDQSDRKLVDWSAPGEYYDRYDIMSAMNVDSYDSDHFGASGPLLNAANLDRMNWLPESRVWTSQTSNSSRTDSFDLVSLSFPEIPGFLAARVGSVYLEFRTQDRWDAGVAYNAVLLHELTGENSIVLASDLSNHVNHWQPGQVYGPDDLDFNINGGTRIMIDSFDLAGNKARITVQQRATRPYVAGPGSVSVGVAAGAGGYITLPSGKRVPVPPNSPLITILEKVAVAADAEQVLGPAASEMVSQTVYADLVATIQASIRQTRGF